MGGTVQVFGNKIPNSILHEWNFDMSEQNEVRECLLFIGAQSFVLQAAIQKYKD